MKRKYSGLLTFIIFFLTVLLVASYATWGTGKDPGRTYTMRRVEPPVNISVPAPSVIQEMETLAREIKDILQPHEMNFSPVNLILFGYQPVKEARSALKGGSGGTPYRTDYNLSLAFVSGKNRFCVIDDIFYEEGSHLKDGARIIKVEPNRVLIRNREIKHWVPLAERKIITKEKQ